MRLRPGTDLDATLTARSLRSHQRRLAGVVDAIAAGQTDARDILAAVTPGGGKSLLPVLAAARLMQAGIVERVCWVVPRDSLRLQAEEAFADPVWRAALGHQLSVRAAGNAPDPSRGLAGYVTTYQGIAAAPRPAPGRVTPLPHAAGGGRGASPAVTGRHRPGHRGAVTQHR